MRRNRLLDGAVLGATLMYLLDRDRGARRRSLIRDQLVHLVRRGSEMSETIATDTRNRGRGMLAEQRSRFRRERVSDPVLEARVRATLGRLVSHPGAIEVTAESGRVALRGPILKDEESRLLSGIAGVRGVKEVENCLEPHTDAGNIPGLQGDAARPEPRFELMQEHWSPAARMLMGSVGGMMIVRGLRDSNPLGRVIGVAGLGIFARAISNLQMKRLTGVGAGRRALDFHKNIIIDAPVEEVFAFWSHYENLPLFLSHLKEVRETGPGRSRWTAHGPGGVPVSWDSEVTSFQENRVIGWKSVGSAPVPNAGIVQFQPEPEGGTRIDIRLSYNPPAGVLGHFFGKLMGVDPKRALDEDMVRLKSLLEQGRTRAHGESITRDEVGIPNP